MAITMTWSLAFKLSCSILLFLQLLIQTVKTMHSASIRVNKFSLLPYYTVIGQAFFMCVYYTAFAAFDLKDQPDIYCIWRDILGDLNVLFFCTLAVLLSLYSDLLRMVLNY